MDEDQSARRNAQKYLKVVDPDYYELEGSFVSSCRRGGGCALTYVSWFVTSLYWHVPLFAAHIFFDDAWEYDEILGCQVPNHFVRQMCAVMDASAR